MIHAIVSYHQSGKCNFRHALQDMSMDIFNYGQFYNSMISLLLDQVHVNSLSQNMKIQNLFKNDLKPPSNF